MRRGHDTRKHSKKIIIRGEVKYSRELGSRNRKRRSYNVDTVYIDRGQQNGEQKVERRAEDAGWFQRGCREICKYAPYMFVASEEWWSAASARQKIPLPLR